MTTLMNVNKVVHNSDWMIANSDEYGYTVIPNNNSVRLQQGICGPVALGVITNTPCHMVIRDMRTYDSTSCTMNNPGTPMSVMQTIITKLFDVHMYTFEEAHTFNTMQRYAIQGTYIVHTKPIDSDVAHYTVLQDGIEYGAGTSANHNVIGYWKLD